MIAFLEGLVLERVGDAEAVVRVSSGVGYRVTVDCRGDRVGDIVKLWIHSITGETGTRLYGFGTTTERDLFVDLLGVKGVGPKTAFAIVLRGVGPVRDALRRRDVAALIGKGCGHKTADAIVGELGGSA
jgi:Holliday junction DNA helicase RuvA